MAISPSRTERSRARIEPEHLERLSEIAAEDHEHFFRGRPEYRRRLLAVVLAQGAGQHYVFGKAGVKDLDVWSFFKAIPGQRFPADKRETHADFGPSSLGRQLYQYECVSDHMRSRFRKWERFEGRRVDLLMRALPVPTRADPAEAIRHWLDHGARMRRRKPPSSSWLARKAVVVIDPASRRGEVVWPKDVAEALRTLSGRSHSVTEAGRTLVATAGLYAIYGSRQVWRELGLGRPPDERPLYVGKSESSLISRDMDTHFANPAEIENALPNSLTGWSTLRRSLAALLADQLNLRGTPRAPHQVNDFAHFGLSKKGDVALSGWMRRRLRVAFWTHSDPLRIRELEKAVKNVWVPPLNLDVRTPWRSFVREARTVLAVQARLAKLRRGGR